MPWSRARFLLETRRLMDAKGHPRWDEDTMRALLGVVHADSWRDLIDKSENLRRAIRTATPDSDGAIAFTALEAGSGDTLELPFRIVAVGQNGIPCAERDPDDAPLRTPTTRTQARREWWVQDETVYVAGVTGALDIALRHIPQPASALAGDDSTVVWPSTHEMYLCYRTAALALMQGGVETQASREIGAVAEKVLKPILYRDLLRKTNAPIRIRADDDAAAWGGM